MTKSTYTHWTVAEKISFRFAFILFALFILFFSNGVFPIPDLLMVSLYKGSQSIVMWLANGILGLNYIPAIVSGGSGDTMHHYIMLLFVSLISVTGCFLWSVFERTKDNYNNLLYWLSVIVRFYVGIMLVHYGLAKVIKVQFASPDLMRLLSIYGDSSPMGLAWTFFGFSDGYNIFTGIAEILCVLLLFRKTVILGAIISLIVSANVMAINYFFDVPVKILSTALVVMSLFLLAPNLYRLVDFFVNGKAVGLKVLEPPVISKRWLLYSKAGFKYIFIALCILPVVFFNLERRENYGDAAPKLPLYGVYIVDSFTSASPAPKWEKLIIQRSTHSAIQMANKVTEYCNMSVDTIKQQLAISFKDDLNTNHTFSYHMPDPDNLELTGLYFDRTLNVKLKKQHFELTERTFNWITENPYNR